MVFNDEYDKSMFSKAKTTILSYEDFMIKGQVQKSEIQKIVNKSNLLIMTNADMQTDIYIKGKYDLLVKLGDGSHLLVDLKISQANVEKIDKYGTQLNAYKFALENPASGDPVKITRLGLLIFYPDQVNFEKANANLIFPPSWLEVPIDDDGFLHFAKKIDTLIAGPTPEESESCQWCKYRHLGDELTHYKPPKNEIPF